MGTPRQGLLSSMWQSCTPGESGVWFDGLWSCIFSIPRLWDSLGPLFGHSWDALGALLGALGAVLGPSGAPLGPLLGHLGGHRSKKRAVPISAPPWGPEKSPLGPLLWRFWNALGRSWGRLGALWGPSWGPLGPSWSHLEASEGYRKRKGEKAQSIDFP